MARSALADFREAAFAQAETGRLEELRLATAEELADEELALGRQAELIGELERLVAQHPLRERLREQLMLALYRSGRQADASRRIRTRGAFSSTSSGSSRDGVCASSRQAILRQDPSLEAVRRSSDRHGRGCPGQRRFRRPRARARPAARRSRGCVRRPRRLFLLVGEPGIGKSRLAEELSHHARVRGARMLVGRCWEAGGAPAYWPWVQSLRGLREGDRSLRALRAQLGDGAGELAQILPELRELLPGLPEPASVDSEGARFRLFDADRAVPAQRVREQADRARARRPPCRRHAIAPAVAVRRARAFRHRILIVGAFRDVDPVPDRALTAMLAEVAREPVHFDASRSAG